VTAQADRCVVGSGAATVQSHFQRWTQNEIGHHPSLPLQLRPNDLGQNVTIRLEFENPRADSSRSPVVVGQRMAMSELHAGRRGQEVANFSSLDFVSQMKVARNDTTHVGMTIKNVEHFVTVQ
jgi:hypothetical protein